MLSWSKLPAATEDEIPHVAQGLWGSSAPQGATIGENAGAKVCDGVWDAHTA